MWRWLDLSSFSRIWKWSSYYRENYEKEDWGLVITVQKTRSLVLYLMGFMLFADWFLCWTSLVLQFVKIIFILTFLDKTHIQRQTCVYPENRGGGGEQRHRHYCCRYVVFCILFQKYLSLSYWISKIEAAKDEAACSESVLLRVGREVVAENSEEPGRLRCEYNETDEERYVKVLNLICWLSHL